MGPRSHQNSKKQAPSFWYSISFGVLIGSFIGFLVISGIYSITQHKYSYINRIVVSGNRVVDSASLTALVDDVLNEYCFVHASCRYGLWLPIDHIHDVILTTYPRIQSVVIEYADNEVSLSVVERDIAFRYCGDESRLYCYFADNNSVLFERAPHMSDLRVIPTVIPDNDKIRVDIVGKILPVRLWSQRDTDSFTKMLEVVGKHARIYNVTFSRRDMNVEVDKLYNYSLVSDTAVLKFNRASLVDATQVPYVIASIDRMKSFQPFASRFSVYPGALEYIDFRFPRRMYMKFGQEQVETVPEKSIDTATSVR
jgi:hypothetical protein